MRPILYAINIYIKSTLSTILNHKAICILNHKREIPNYKKDNLSIQFMNYKGKHARTKRNNMTTFLQSLPKLKREIHTIKFTYPTYIAHYHLWGA